MLISDQCLHYMNLLPFPIFIAVIFEKKKNASGTRKLFDVHYRFPQNQLNPKYLLSIFFSKETANVFFLSDLCTFEQSRHEYCTYHTVLLIKTF